jgi:uncharacterized iron-regulated membrane protein
MTIHEGGYLGKPLSPIYIMLVGLGLVGLVITGITMIRREKVVHPVESKSPKISNRALHHFLAPIFSLPLFVSASTGIIYRLGKSWLGLSDKQAHFLMDIHQGTYLGPLLRAWYVLLIGLGLIMILITGIQMTNILRKSKSI